MNKNLHNYIWMLGTVETVAGLCIDIKSIVHRKNDLAGSINCVDIKKML